MTEEQKGLYTVKSCPWLLLFVFYLQFVIGEILNLVWTKYFNTAVPKLLALTCVQIFAIAIPCGIFILLKNVRPHEVIKHKKISGIAVIMCVIVGISAQPVASLINSPMIIWLSKHGYEQSELISNPNGIGSFALTIIVVALLPAIFEEILMRGIILHATEKHGYRASLFISAIWFSILHNNLSNLFGTMFLGLVLCYAVWMTQSVYAGIIIHFSFNFTALVWQYISSTIQQTPFALAFTLIAVFVIMFILSVSSLNRKLVRRYKTHGLFKQLIFCILNVPMIIIILGYIMFQFVK